MQFRMKLRPFLFVLVVITIVAIAAILHISSTQDKIPTATRNVLEPSPLPSPVERPTPTPEATPEASVNARDKALAKLSESVRAEVERIDAYVESVDKLSNKRGPDLIFADLSGHAGEKKEKWVRFASEPALEKARRRFEKKGGHYKIAYVWHNEGRIVAANAMVSSSSGDWTKDVYQYFREDGSLAFVLSHFGTFVGYHKPYKFEQHKYFDLNGGSICTFEEYYDFDDATIEKAPEDLETGDLRDRIDYYMTVRQLPFARLLRKKRS